jgi:uncharacterized protein (DUF2141 family)
MKYSFKLFVLLFAAFSMALSSCKKFNTEDGPDAEVQDSLLASTRIILDVYGFNPLSGDLGVAIYENSSTFNSSTVYRDTFVAVTSIDMILIFDRVDVGTYAISLFHDENSNGEMDKNILGLPLEGFGFSNNPSIGFSEPTFSECNFDIEAGQEVFVPVNLIYF